MRDLEVKKGKAKMLSLRTGCTSAFVVLSAMTASCSSEDDDGTSQLATAGNAGLGGSVGFAGQNAVASGGTGVVAAGGQTPFGTGGSVVASGGIPSVASGGMSSAGMTGSGGSSLGGASGSGGAGTSGAAGQAGSGAAGEGAGGGAGGGSNPQALPPTSNYAQAGPFETTTQTNTGPSNGYAIFRPDPLGTDGFLHSPIIFGPGILTTPSMYGSLLTHLASHGFVSIVVNSLGGGPGAQANVDAMKRGLDWLIAQNGESGVFQGKLAVDRAITMGYSLGATASVQLSSHEAIVTTVSIHGHGTSGDPHGPVLLLTGTSDVIGSVRQTHGTLEEAPAVLMALPIGHLDVLTELAMLSSISASSRYIAPITAWLRYWINGDQDAKRYFWGADCEMCSSPWITPETNAAWDAQML